MTDSYGKPSLTVTILIYTMILFGVVVGVASTNALVIKTFTSADKIVSAEPTGFSDTFLVMMMGLTVILTGFYRQRQNKKGSDEPEERNGGGIVDTIKQFVANKISTISYGNTNSMGGMMGSMGETVVGDPKDVVGQ